MGALSIYTGGVCRGTSKKGGLRHGHKPKTGGGVLGMGTSKKGGLRHGHESNKGGGVLKRGGGSYKKDNLSNCCCTKGDLGSLFIDYPYFFLVNMINWWGFTLTD